MEFELRHVIGLEIVNCAGDAHLAVVVGEQAGGGKGENYISAWGDERFQEAESGVVGADGVKGVGQRLVFEGFADFGHNFWVAVVEYEVCSQRFDIFMLLPSIMFPKNTRIQRGKGAARDKAGQISDGEECT